MNFFILSPLIAGMISAMLGYFIGKVNNRENKQLAKISKLKKKIELLKSKKDSSKKGNENCLSNTKKQQESSKKSVIIKN